MVVAENYVKIEPGKYVSMRFDQFTWHTRDVMDPVLKMPKTVKNLVFHVVELNGEPANTVFSVISEKLQREFEPYLDRERFRSYRFTITREAGAYTAPRILSAVPI